MKKPLAIDLFSGKGGWTMGLLDAGFRVIGFDLERWPDYPGELVIQDVLTLHGSQFRDAALIVASPPCQAYSYRAMPWKRAKALPPPDNTLFETCFRLQREASEAAGRRIPMVVENVCGAQKWVGRARWHYGSYYLWGDVPALMPFGVVRKGTGGSVCSYHGKNGGGDTWQGIKGITPNPNGEAPNGTGKSSWFFQQRADPRDLRRMPDGNWGIKQGGEWWHDHESMSRRFSSRSAARKAASAQIAMIPYPLALYIGRTFYPCGF